MLPKNLRALSRLSQPLIKPLLRRVAFHNPVKEGFALGLNSVKQRARVGVIDGLQGLRAYDTVRLYS